MNDRLKYVAIRLFYSSLQVLDITFLAYYGKECFDTKSRIISNTRAQTTINITTILPSIDYIGSNQNLKKKTYFM